MARARRGERGFSMIEVLVAILVFGLMTVGIIPLLLSSLKGSTLARQQTVGKNLAQESMERVRGLPLFDTAPGRDVLDLYFPNLVVSGPDGYDAGTQTFTTTCTQTSSLPLPSATRACPKLPSGASKIPPGYTVTFRATFVAPTPASNPETFTVVTPSATYSSAAAGTATPPTKLVRFVITVSWPFQDRPQTFELTSLIGDRRLSPDRVRANATVDFVAQALTSFKVGTSISGLNATAGTSISTVEIRNFAAAIGDVDAGGLVLARDQSATDPGEVIDSAAGAATSLRAPPDTSPAGTVTGGAGNVVHDELFPPGTRVGGIGTTSVNLSSPLAEVKVPNGLPSAATNFEFTGGVGEIFWVNNQADTSETALLKLDPLRHVFSVHRPPSNKKTSGYTSAVATALTPAGSRKVETVAHAESGKLVLLPTTFTTGVDKGIVVITDFVADMSCRSTGALSAPVATGSWSATFQYWRDSFPNDNLPFGSYVEVETIANSDKISGSVTSTAVDPLAAIKLENPLVYDGLTPASDVYLFNDPTAVPAKLGYLDHWSSSPIMASTTADKLARVSMPFAIQLVTAKTNSVDEESKLTASVGKMSCEAEDLR